MSPRISLGYASRERPWRAGWPSYDFQSCCNSIAGNGMRIVDETRPRHLKGWMECRDQTRAAALLEQKLPEVGGLTRLSFLAARGAGPPSRSSPRGRKIRRPRRGPPATGPHRGSRAGVGGAEVAGIIILLLALIGLGFSVDPVALLDRKSVV